MRIKNHRNRKIGIIGKIKVGETIEKDGRQIPKSLDYFKATSDNAFNVQCFDNLYPKKNCLPIWFAGDDDDFNSDHRFEIRNHQGKVYAYGDGFNFYVSNGKEMRYIDFDTISKKYGNPESFMQKTEAYLSTSRYQASFSEVLTLRFVIAQIPVMGVWQLQTKASKSSIDQILGNYDQIKSLNGGTLKNIPFFLNVKKVVGNTAMKYNRSYPVLSLTPFLSQEAEKNINIIESNKISLIDERNG